ncbi:hypothetical protein ASE23_20235 [Rhizobium sp. Root73]|uniref:PD-(D/E)XK nuclease family protein n=1 Tax=unclassified Rhizobium TaxID=2613769 RepID=UPI00072852AC|nr:MULTISPECIES: PD-(D/E)XK nuclease family protein [unclassified Rhizobium]KQY16314.1 hypothetical protein ASD36_22910 [Rhizobium sp. Root1334]KRC12693.1 hypothetical protein ASE23_20235 [Rhizobium sp. Root73]
MNEEFIPTLSHATERDIDLLLVEEIHASLDFTVWIARQAGINLPIASWDVKHSKRRTRSRREIDIFVEIEHSDQTRSALLIENKLDASEQPDQAESYREELDALAGGYARRAMMIVCPNAYAAQFPNFTGKFDATISYELIAEFLRELRDESGSEMVPRYQFRAEIIDQAIHKHRRGYTPIPDKIVGDFNAQYVALLATIAPEILPGPSMRKTANPRESTSMIFDQAASLRGLAEAIRPRRFAHELGRGSDQRANYVAVTFPGWGVAPSAVVDVMSADVAELGAIFSAKTPTKIRPNPGLVMALPTTPVDNQRDFYAQIEAISAGVVTAARLRNWLIDNQNVLSKWRALVDAEIAR